MPANHMHISQSSIHPSMAKLLNHGLQKASATADDLHDFTLHAMCILILFNMKNAYKDEESRSNL